MRNFVLTFDNFVVESKSQTPPIRIFCDMDGVLTDFDRGFKRLRINPKHYTPDEYEKKHGKHSIWSLIDKRKDKFWKRLPWTKDGRELWDYLDRYSPYILSAPSRSEYSKEGKLTWVSLNLGINQKKAITTPEELEEDPDKRVILSKDKELFVKSANDILIDDKKINIEKWTAAGGTGIIHNDSTDTIRILEEIISKIQGPSLDDEDEDTDETEETSVDETPEEVNESTELSTLKKQYPNAKMTLKKSDKFDNMYYAKVDIIKQDGSTQYLGALKGLVSKDQALEFFGKILKREYDKYY